MSPAIIRRLGRFRSCQFSRSHRPKGQLLDHHVRLPDEQGGLRTHGRHPGVDGVSASERGTQRGSGACVYVEAAAMAAVEDVTLAVMLAVVMVYHRRHL